jgi:hypothetical protein
MGRTRSMAQVCQNSQVCNDGRIASSGHAALTRRIRAGRRFYSLIMRTSSGGHSPQRVFQNPNPRQHSHVSFPQLQTSRRVCSGQLRAITGNRGSFQRLGDWDRFGVAREHSMKLRRRQFLHLGAGAATLLTVSRAARAQAYPTRPITIVVPLARGDHPT